VNKLLCFIFGHLLVYTKWESWCNTNGGSYIREHKCTRCGHIESATISSGGPKPLDI
jgi:hypothetical protein